MRTCVNGGYPRVMCAGHNGKGRYVWITGERESRIYSNQRLIMESNCHGQSVSPDSETGI